jgi:small GTP-binding protein
MKAESIRKILVLGDTSVGKSSLLIRRNENKFITDHKPTIGTDFTTNVYSFQGSEVKIQIWDIGGGLKISPMYFRSANGVFICFDVTNFMSFENISFWLTEIEKNSPPNVLIHILGTKCDLKKDRVIDYDQAKDFAFEHKCKYSEVSSKTGENVDEVFNNFYDQLMLETKEFSRKEMPELENEGSCLIL